MKSKNTLIPARLKPGDKVGIAAPASPFDMENYNLGVHVLESMGFYVSVLDDIFDKNTYLAGPDVNRAKLLNKLFADSSIKAIICARGGYGSIRILPLLDYNIIRNNPKIFVGFSDVSAILSAIYTKCGLVTFHGPMVTTMADASQKTKESMMAAFLSDSKLNVTIKNGIALRHGSASGIVSGGNLATLCHLPGASYENHLSFQVIKNMGCYITHMSILYIIPKQSRLFWIYGKYSHHISISYFFVFHRESAAQTHLPLHTCFQQRPTPRASLLRFFFR